MYTDSFTLDYASDGSVTVNPAPITDLADNQMENTFVFQFQTVAPPDLPENPFPEYAIWWSGADRVGTIDTINQQGLADQFNGTVFPTGVPINVVPQFTDTIASSQNIQNFDPFEINFDGRTNTGTCHSWVYVQSKNTGQVAILNTRNAIPVALIDSPTPAQRLVFGDQRRRIPELFNLDYPAMQQAMNC